MTETNKKTRMVEQDIAKGLGIVLVIMLHTLTLKREVYLVMGCLVGFILPFYFFMAGYNHRPGKYTFAENVKKRAAQMLIPFIKYLTGVMLIVGTYVYFVEDDTLAHIGATYLRALLTKPLTNLLGIETQSDTLSRCVMAFWFILMLFSGSVVFFLFVDRCLSSMSSLISICCGLVGVSMLLAHFEIKLPFFISEAPAIACLMILGAAFGRHNLLGPDLGRKKIIINAVIGYAIYLVFAIMFQGSGFIAGGNLCYKPLYEWNIPLTVIFAITGSYAFVHFCRILTRFKFITAVFSWLGAHTIPLLLLHNVVQFFICRLLKMEPFRMSTHSEINDFRTFGVLALELAVTSIIIILLEKIPKKTSKKMT